MTDPTHPTNELREADGLLDGVNRSIFLKALALSALAHVLLVGLSSFGLYKDWAEFGMASETHGFHTPSVIKTIRRERVKAAEQAERDKRLEERIAAQRAEAERLAESATPTPAPALESSAPVEPTVEPLPPKETFSLDDLPGLGL